MAPGYTRRMHSVRATVLMMALAVPAVGREPPTVARRLPPAGAAADELAAKLDPAARAAWDGVAERLASLRSRLVAARFADDAERADVEVLLKAVEYAVAGDEWWQPSDLRHAAWAVDEAEARIDAVASGRRSESAARGLSVHGFRSRLDGSLQPYGLWIPEGLDLTRPAPLWIWLHGRGEKETDLHFLHQRAHKPPEFRPDDAVVLLPFGRYCNGWKGPGLVDVFEARDDVARSLSIDPDRVVLAGFSMGGAGAWQIGARRIGEFCGVHGGAGFVDTRRYTGVDVATIPWYEARLWTTTDVPPVARNLLNRPAIAYSGELDRQRAAAEIMVETLAAEGHDLPHVVGAGMAHTYDEASRATITAFLQRAVAAGRPRRPAAVHLATTTLADSRVDWVEVLGLGEHFAAAGRVDAGLAESDGRMQLSATTANVTAVAFHVDPRLSSLCVDGQHLVSASRPADAPLIIARNGLRRDASWSVVAPSDLPSFRKRPGLTGPVDDAFTAPFIVVPPTRAGIDPAIDRFVARELEHVRRRWHDLFRGDLPLTESDDVTDDMLRSRHLVLFGDPVSNPLLARVLPEMPIRWSRDGLVVAGTTYDATRHVPILIQPNPLCPPTPSAAGTYVVLNSGVTFREESDASNAWQNPKLPDWTVVDVTVPADGRAPGRIAAAGFCDEWWRITGP